MVGWLESEKVAMMALWKVVTTGNVKVYQMEFVKVDWKAMILAEKKVDLMVVSKGAEMVVSLDA